MPVIECSKSSDGSCAVTLDRKIGDALTELADEANDETTIRLRR